MSLSVRFDDIRKDFGPVRVLHGVSFDLAPGRIYGLLGENGAGKSTLMKILAGYERPTAGTVSIDGVLKTFNSSRDAEATGIVLIHQELNLADHLSIVQNMFLGHEKRRGLFLDEPAMREAARARLADVGLHKHPDTGAILVHLTDQNMRLTLSDGTTRDSRYAAKQVRWVGPGTAHQDENLSDTPLKFIRIELKLAVSQ